MFHSRALASLLATLSLLGGSLALAAGGIEPIPAQDIPSGKTLVIPITATDPGGPARSYTVTVGTPTTNGKATTTAGITAAIRTGDPHLFVAVRYTDSNNVRQSGTMEFQLLREFSPVTTEIIGGLTQGGYYSPQVDGTSTKYILFNRVYAGFVVQLGSVSGDGRGGPGFTFENEFNPALIFSGTLGQLAMANGGTGENGGTNGSQYFITLAPQRELDFQHTILGQLVRGAATLNGIAGTPINFSDPVVVGGKIEYSIPLNPVDITAASVSPSNTDALLLLSATGVCDAVITITSPGNAVRTFTAHAVADTTSDPPVLQPVPNTTAPNGSVSVTLSGTDLQLDLLRYGYQRVLPAADNTVTSGTSPVITVPLISSTDNTVDALLDHWNPSDRGYDDRIFHVGAGVKPLTGTLTPVPAGTFGKLNLVSFPLVQFASPNAGDTAAGFTSSVNWGDGGFVSGTNVTIVKQAAGHFKLVASHDYQHAGEFPIIVKIADPGGAHLTLTGATNIGASAIAISGTDIVHAGGGLSNVVVATFKDVGASSAPADYSATINWGDGISSAGVVKTASGGAFQVLGTHAYRMADSFTVSTSVTRTGAGGYSGSTWIAAHISGVTAPQVFPPFSQAHLAQIWSPIYTDSNSIATTGSGSGGNPYAALITGADRNFYGTTLDGGPGNDGTIYRITASGSLDTIYSFTGGSDGASPQAALVQGTNGDFYGTAETDGSNGGGTIYQVTSSGSLTVLHSFSGAADGSAPVAPLIAGTNGDFYGTTVTGGSDNYGVVYQISPGGSIQTLHTFTSGTNDGGNPYAGLVTGTDGNFYGTTLYGTSFNAGVVYRLTSTGTGTYTYTTLHAFTTSTNAVTHPDGAFPYAALVQGTDGYFYGTTSQGGSSDDGTVFRISTSGSLTTLHSFSGIDGQNPYAALVRGTNGAFYGTTVSGGMTVTGGTSTFGTVYSITPDGTFDSLHTFAGGDDGRNPHGTLVRGANGDFYGTTEIGGAAGYGTVFRITPGGTLTTLHAFESGNTFQLALRGSIAIINSGNVASKPGAFAVYVAPDGVVDASAVPFTSDGRVSFSIPALDPGKYSILTFFLEGSVVDSRLKLPIGYLPTGLPVIGVVTYSDPVANFDGSEKIISPFSF